jgi:hypothetical protein
MLYEPEWSCGTSFLVEPTSSAPSLEFQVYDTNVTWNASLVEGEIKAISGQNADTGNFPLPSFGGTGTKTDNKMAGWRSGCTIWGRQEMPDQDQADVRLVLARLRQEHEDYDAAINAMIQTNCEALRIQRMKKKKLVIKDKMTQIEDQIIPDIIA